MRGVTDDPMGALTQGDVLLLPTVEEGSALVTYEAQIAGCVPLVSTAAGAVIDEGVTGFTHEVGDVGRADRTPRHPVASIPRCCERCGMRALAAADDLTWTAAARRQVDAYLAAIALTDESRRAAA